MAGIAGFKEGSMGRGFVDDGIQVPCLGVPAEHS